MKICDSCGKFGGEHTPFCKYQNKNPEMLDVHESHKMMGDGKCQYCGRSDVPGLVLACDKVAEAYPEKEIFPIDSSHLTALKNGRWWCKFCGGTDRQTLEQACTRNPETFNFAAVEVHPSHRIKWDDGKAVNCEACGASSPVELTTDCVNASPTGRLRGPRRFTPSYKGTLLPDDKVWAIYYWEHSPMIVSIHARPEQAINSNTLNNSIFPWKLGTDFGEAVRAWESRNSEEEKKE